jgi:hypothetical protein
LSYGNKKLKKFSVLFFWFVKNNLKFWLDSLLK